VLPDGVEMGRFLIIGDNRNAHSRRSNTGYCAVLMTSANTSKKAAFTLGNLSSIRWTTGTFY